MIENSHFNNLSQIERDLGLTQIENSKVSGLGQPLLTASLDSGLSPEEVLGSINNYRFDTYEDLDDKELGGEEIKLFENNLRGWKQILDDAIPVFDLSHDYILC